MKYVYLKPKLDNLSQGERIAFARQIRRMLQDEVSDKIGLTGECKRRTMARYERGDRIPKDDRLLEIANILNINVKYLKKYDFRNNEDVIYLLLWMEEMYPRMKIDFGISEYFLNKSDRSIQKFINERNEMREKRKTHEITYNEYVDWKFQYEFKEGDKDEKDS